MPDKNVFERAIDVLNERGWNQGRVEGPDGSRCLVGALLYVKGDLSWVEEDVHLCAVIGLERDPDGFISPLPEWNDDPSRSYEDVVLALKEAASTGRAATRTTSSRSPTERTSTAA
jgi:hypothetical protein